MSYVRRHRVSGVERLFLAILTVEAAWTASDTDYWFITLRHRRIVEGVLQTIGEDLGTCDLSELTFDASESVTIFEDAKGLRATDGEELVFTVDRVGTPVALSDPQVHLDLFRDAR